MKCCPLFEPNVKDYLKVRGEVVANKIVNKSKPKKKTLFR
jgi:hypothetical protein